MSKKRAVLGILPTRGDTCILLLRRAKESRLFPDKFSLVGGGVDEGESDIIALVREFKEETGKDIRIINYYSTFENEEYEIIVYLVEDLTPDQLVKLNPREHSAYHEFTIKNIEMHEDIITPEVFKILKGIKTLKAVEVSTGKEQVMHNI